MEKTNTMLHTTIQATPLKPPFLHLIGPNTSDDDSQGSFNRSLSAEPNPVVTLDNFQTDQKPGLQPVYPKGSTDSKDNPTSPLDLQNDTFTERLECSRKPRTEKRMQTMLNVEDLRSRQTTFLKPFGKDLRRSSTSDYVSPGNSYKSTEFSLSAEPGPVVSSDNYKTDQKSGLQSLHLVPTISTYSSDNSTSSLHLYDDKYTETLECPRKPGTEKRMQTIKPETETNSNDKPTSSIESSTSHRSLPRIIVSSSD
ncbi:hypothetical protein CHS0354_026473 [Potamilus streckersoni]|uniref:Uncharacterized protein n=1 Tax=Potamilus streckersoni TaxID=2493646 RepID=A0AAE0VHX7_9BIVA|nr:hypothetical protein CHS0354_026473 [Potamilus streckersoni]